jgi:hypothetical protein
MRLEEIADPKTLDWLLEKSNPSVRYHTLTKLLGKPDSYADALEAKRDIMRAGIVPEILERQDEAGFWGEPDTFYTDKYKGTVWQLMILAEMGASPEDEHVCKACEFILANSQEAESGGFSTHSSAKNGSGRRGEVIPCLTGNMVWSLIRLGFGGDIRVQKGIDWICRYQRCDDGIPEGERPNGWPYDRYEMCWGRHTCHMGVVKALKALSAIPEDDRSDAVQAKIHELTEYLLLHHIYKKSHNLQSVSKPGWLKFGFPLMYQTDALEILGILTDLGSRDERMAEALELVKRKQKENGRWLLENTFNGRMIRDIEEKGKESKWITLKALYILANS